MQNLRIEIKKSQYFQSIVIIFHVITALMVLWVPLSLPLKCTCLLLSGFSGWYFLQLAREGLVITMDDSLDGIIHPVGQCPHAARFVTPCYVSRYFVYLRYRRDSQWRKTPLIICRDAVERDTFRALRVILRQWA